MENFKFIAGQASSINQYKNTRSKLLKCCANIYFNTQCLAKKIIPNYTKIKVQNTSPEVSPDIYIIVYKQNVVLTTDV